MSETGTSRILPQLPSLSWPDLHQLDPVLGLAAVMLLAVVTASALHRLLRLPRLAGYMLVGALASPLALGLLQPTDLDAWKPIIDLAIAALVFELGSRLRPRWLIDNPWLAASCVLEGLCAALAVGAVLVALGAPLLSAVLADAFHSQVDQGKTVVVTDLRQTIFNGYPSHIFFPPFVQMREGAWLSAARRPRANSDGVAKTPQLLRCAASFVTAAYRMYASFLRICAPCICGFLLSHLIQ
jgi:hypothetical protein